MVIGRGPRPGGDGSRSGAVPVGASGGPAARLRQQPWTDPRLVLGVLLVLGATVLGASVVAAADDTEAYWALARDVEAGDPVRRGDLVETRARVDGDAAGALLRTDQALPGRLEALQWSRAGAEGALVGRADLVADGATATVELPLSVALGAAPDDLRAGERVDVWVGPSPDGDPVATDSGPARLLLEGVAVVRAGAVGASGGARTVLVDVGPDLDGATLARLTSGHVTIVRRS